MKQNSILFSPWLLQSPVQGRRGLGVWGLGVSERRSFSLGFFVYGVWGSACDKTFGYVCVMGHPGLCSLHCGIAGLTALECLSFDRLGSQHLCFVFSLSLSLPLSLPPSFQAISNHHPKPRP